MVNDQMLYTWAIEAVCEEMQSHGYSFRLGNEPADETVVFFEKDKERWGIVLPKLNNSVGLVADAPFTLDDFRRQRKGLNISLRGCNDAEEEKVKTYVKGKINNFWFSFSIYGRKMSDLFGNGLKCCLR